MKIRLVILAILVLALSGVLYWKGDRSYREQAGLLDTVPAMTQALTADDILPPPGAPHTGEPEEAKVTTTQVPTEEEAPVGETTGTELAQDTTSETGMPQGVTGPTHGLVATRAGRAEAGSEDEKGIAPLPFAWMSPAQEPQPGFVAPAREDARLPNLVLRPQTPNAPDLNRLFKDAK